MASRTFNNNTLTLEGEVVRLYAEVAIGASGAPTLTRGKGIASVAGGAGASATGLYTFTLDDKYQDLLFGAGTLQRATAIDLNVQLKTETVASTKTVVFQVTDFATPALTDPSSGDVLYVVMELRNSER